MTLLDEIATLITDIRLKDPEEAAELILALVKANLTSAAAAERARRQLSFHPSVRAAILAALGDDA